MNFPLIAARLSLIVIGLGLWYWTQWLLARRMPPAGEAGAGEIRDGIHRLTAGINRRLLDHPHRANVLLITSSGVIDLLGFYLLASAIFGPSIEPFLGLLMLFALRQFCQAFCPLPPPPGMIWRNPGFPAILVTYGTSNDLFFSGHTAIAVYGAAVLATAFGAAGIVLGICIAVFEMAAVLVLRAHYTMDVFVGAVTALYVHRLAMEWAPTIDRWIGHFVNVAIH
jgi:PAP2 superfamily